MNNKEDNSFFRGDLPLGSISIRIADIAIAIASKDPDFKLGVPATMKSFLVKEEKPDIRLQAAPADLSEEPRGEKIFDPGTHWQLFRSNGRYLFRFVTSVRGLIPYKIAIFQSDFTCGEVYLHRRYFNREEPVYPLEPPLDEVMIVNMLSRGRGVEVHACGVVDYNGDGLLFIGPSGAGKSTIAKFWRGESDITILSDDRIVLRHLEGTLWMYGTPWHGEAGFALPDRAPLKRIYFLQHGEENELVPVGIVSAVGRLFACSFVPFYSHEGLDFTLGFLEEVVKAVPCYEMKFVPDKKVVRFIQSFED